jgi:ligand-binding sensor domain-containing protein/serine phosphatase RsbU (regulator of sigma subunit)
MFKRLSILFISVICLQLFSVGQKSDIKFEHISMEDGLSQSVVLSIFQDSEGFMWFGTLDGLNKYDGYTIKIYRNDPDNPNSIADNYINAIFEDKDGNIWVGTRSSGLCKFDKKSEKFHTYSHVPQIKTTLSSNNVKTIFQDSWGDIWIGTNNGLNKLVTSRRKSGLQDIEEDSLQILIRDAIENRYMRFANEAEEVPDKEFPVMDGNNIRVIEGVGEVLMEEQSDEKIEAGKDNAGNQSDEGDVIYEQEEEQVNDIPESEVEKHTRDSLRFIRYMADSDDPYSLSSNSINQILEVENGNLLIATENGLNEFDPVIGKVVFKVPNLAGEKGEEDNILCEYIDSRGFLWVGTNHGLKKIDRLSGKMKVFTHDPDDLFSISDNVVTSIIEDKYGVLWVGTDNAGLNKYDPNTGHFVRYQNDPSNPFSLSVPSIKVLYFDRADILWIGTYLGGINKWDRTASGIALFRKSPFNPNGLNSNQIRTVYVDKEDNIWIGTVDAGLNKWDTKTNTFTHYTYDEDNPASLSNNHVRSIIEDARGNMWIGTDGGGVDILIPGTTNFEHHRYDPDNPYSLSNNRVWELYQDSENQIWIGTFGGGLNKFNPEDDNFIHYQHIPSDDNSLSDDKVTAIFEDHLGVLWVGTFGGGLNKWDDDNLEFTRYEYQKSNKNSLGNNRVYSIFEDSDGVLWIGTKGSLNIFDRETENFQRYTENNGLPNNVIMGILEDDQGNLWVSTNNGIAKFNKETENIRNYDVKNGLQSNEFLVGSYFKDYKGKMYFGGINGLNAFYPDSVKNNQHPPKMIITDFKLFNRSVKPGPDSPLKYDITKTRSITLTHKQNAFSFEFAALHYSQPEKNQYAYMMENFDKDWIHTDARHRIATYTNLDPDEYVFKVKGSNSDGIWNEEGTSIKVEVLPPYWETWWFRGIVVFFVVCVVYIIYRIRVKSIEKQKKVLENLVKQRTAQVEQQKEEIMAQRDDLEKQNNKIEMQNEQIKSSIRYALTIQSAILPIEDNIKPLFNFFLIYRPKDIVSGDFYWFSHITKEQQQNGEGEKIFLAAVDCTGHGVPGAFMSLIGNRLLGEIVNERRIFNPGEILDRLNNGVRSALKQEQTENNEGMDVCLCVFEPINENQTKVSFAGAKRPLFYYKQGDKDLSVIKGDRKSIGGIHSRLDKQPFKSHDITLNSGDLLYLTTDGIIDQNAPDRKRFGSLRFMETIRQNIMLSMDRQKKTIEDVLDLYMQDAEQRDDITVFGIRLK